MDERDQATVVGGTTSFTREEQPEERNKNEVTLLEIKRKVQNEKEAQKDDHKQRKFKIINYTSKDSLVSKVEKDFFLYFCFLCGYNCLISETDVADLPRRTTDGSIIFPFKKIVHKKFHKTKKEHILIRRKEDALEVQFRILCKECGVPIGYVNSLDQDNAFIYYYSYSFVRSQTKSRLFKDISL
ncbi:conserved Plasmodium protein, unknown function [Plasmodium knowlesi strain H]|uniref:STEEP1 domain-containing protein n=3 Tax=Plasmodium knowlesi TaxID=5850 RepID=A0A5K1VGE5_PLAKH|nr:uncharacterized protein PKNH_1466900 [Plasmodium knowlesi strain H]OTN63863.1 Uncharacterized protein PKNOH_S140285600 [Plasmodium knowlesi]CAA9991266.1 conserved protein, unknown function [Plasmodium knowlesi strain H]SBO26353.1 conserved Plasmodium protein, unknown function [Plasmodium knowlesi strain H]SBO29027.1 conserved Plasmodium protein, unknown function [Plasmodium knowlesi strain H]VVS80740.1 conserved protein, unknown function [Plasmodium knowlesi strain H]|eukprot:XP_002262545.1 [Plasmodium knowlesi strain H]